MKKKRKFLLACFDVKDELLTSGEYEVITERTDTDGTEHFTVINELGLQKEYPEYYFDLECK